MSSNTLQDTLNDIQDLYGLLNAKLLGLTKEQVTAIANGGDHDLTNDELNVLDSFMRRRINAGLTAYCWSSMDLNPTNADCNW